AALAEGTVLATYRLDRYRSRDGEDDSAPPPGLERLAITVAGDERDAAAAEAEAATVAALAANRARELQDLPANALNPEALAARAREIAGEHEAVEVEVLDRAAVAAAGMGGLTAVAAGTDAEPRLIAL